MSPEVEKVYLDGRIVPAAEAKVSVFDAGFTHAAGLFETMRVYHGRVMRVDDHLERMARSAVDLHMHLRAHEGVSPERLRQAIAELLAASELADARLRLTITPGVIPRDGEPDDTPPRPTVLITARKVRPYPAELYADGMRVCICPYKQSRLDPLAGHKTLAYLPRLLAMRHAAERNCHEALWFNTENQLAEGSICNVFTVREGTLITPPVETPVLPGIVRQMVIELAAAAGITVEQRPIVIDDLLAADEVFLTGSVMEIMPVTNIEQHQVGNGAPGAVTRRLKELYAELIARECG